MKVLACSTEDRGEKPACRYTVAAARWSYFLNTVRPAISDHWLCHSIALTYLDSVDAANDEIEGPGCGPIAFAAIAGIPVKELVGYFPDMGQLPWTNRKRMEQALHSFGWNFTKLQDAWPKVGLCLIHWCGPWTDRGYAHGILQRTHWVAVVAEYVFDTNWRGWLPRENWEDAVVPELLHAHGAAYGWKPLTCYELAVG
jgi:hypothetical protein